MLGAAGTPRQAQLRSETFDSRESQWWFNGDLMGFCLTENLVLTLQNSEIHG